LKKKKMKKESDGPQYLKPTNRAEGYNNAMDAYRKDNASTSTVTKHLPTKP
jgi:hypothetical protein